MIYINISEGLIDRFLDFFKNKNIDCKQIDNYILKIDYDYINFIQFINKYNYIKRFIYRVYFTNNEVSSNKELLENLELENKTLRLMVHPKYKEKEILKLLESENIKLSPTEYTHILYIVKNQMYSTFEYGLLPKNKAYIKENSKPHICRAYYKLKEIVEREHIDLNNKIILDIGAAPGGWCEYAKEYAKKIIAVDPAELKIKSDNIIYFKNKIEDIIPKVNKYDYNIIISDINLDPKLILDSIFKLDYTGKILILTLKFNKTSKNYISNRIQKIKEDLSKKCKYTKDYWLFANTASERTLVCKFK